MNSTSNFTSQINTKQGNRRSESLLREAELWAALAATYADFDYPYDALDRAWKNMLLCQFHDILPGTSIAWAYREVAALYRGILDTTETIIRDALAALGTTQTTTVRTPGDAVPGIDAGHAYANATAFAVAGTPALGIGSADSASPVTVNGRVLDNGIVRAEFNEGGGLISLIDLATGRDYIPAGQVAGELHLHQDFPNMWDAWDLDPFYRGSKTVLTDTTFHGVDEDGSARVDVDFNASHATLTWSLKPGARALDLHVALDWHENEKILKLAFPVDIHTDHAQYETQMGYLTRPTHENTSWEAYKFEVSCHRWLRLANPSASLAVANDATYGWDITRHAHDGGGTWSLVRASLARAAQFPDPEQDRGHHEWNFQLLPGASVVDAVAAGQAINLPPRALDTAPTLTLRDGSAIDGSPISIDGAVVESVSLAPDRSGDMVVRLYEATGGESTARIRIAGASEVRGVDLRYRDSDHAVALTREGDEWAARLRPFQIATLRVSFGTAGEVEMGSVDK